LLNIEAENSRPRKYLCSLLCPPLEGRSVRIPRGCGSQKSKTLRGLTRGGDGSSQFANDHLSL